MPALDPRFSWQTPAYGVAPFLVQKLPLIVYLTDVDIGSGPHVYVDRSHRTAAQLRACPYARSAIDARYGSAAVHTVTGPRGTAFTADTYGSHTGMAPTHTPRVILQAQYSLLPVFAFHYDAVVISGTSSLDPYLNRLLIARQAAV